MSKKSTALKFPTLAGMILLPHLFLTACMDQEITRSQDQDPPSAQHGERSAKFPETIVIDGESFVRDETTGEMYSLNPNRTPLPMGGAVSEGLMKTAGLLYSAFDGSGTVEIRIWECKTATRQEIQSIACTVDPNYVVVGGGARTVYYGSGALLTEARPLDAGLYTYVGSSKSHKSSDPHDLYVYAIGMRLVGVTRNNLWLQTEFKSATSASSESPSASASTSSGYLAIGGGAKVNWSHPGNMLTGNYACASTDRCWGGAAKSHKASSPATITVYVIGINPSVPNFGTLHVAHTSIPVYGPSYGVIKGSQGIASGYVLSCPGASSSFYSGSGRLLFGIYPEPNFHGGFWASSKDHLTASDGNLLLQGKQVRRL